MFGAGKGTLLCWTSYLNFLIVCLQILSLCLEPSEQGASVCVRRMNEDKLSVLELLQHLHPDVGLVGVGGQSAQKRNVDVLGNVKNTYSFYQLELLSQALNEVPATQLE